MPAMVADVEDDKETADVGLTEALPNRQTTENNKYEYPGEKMLTK